VIFVSSTGQPPDRCQQIRLWCFQNGLLAAGLVEPLRVDMGQRTITYDQVIAEPQPGDTDFPELRRDDENRPITEVKVVSLLVDPPAWLVPSETHPMVA